MQLPLPALAAQFQLDSEVTFLNHGSYGACPRPVFDIYQKWQREVELNPVEFIGMRLQDLLTDARGKLAPFVGTEADNIVFVRNATFGINIVAHSLKLEPGDEILTTDHEYNAINNAWQFNCDGQGAVYIKQPIPLPLEDPEDVVEHLWAGVTEKTKVIAISHITSPTALIMPVEEICRRARAAGIITVIDGAHAPGQIELDIEEIGADYYSGNCHKWLSSPRGAGFLYARPEMQNLLDPLVVSHGWNDARPEQSQFLKFLSYTGTEDASAYLSVPAAIKFQDENNWREVRAACHSLLQEAERRILELSDFPALSPDSMWMQLRAIPLPGQASDYAHLWQEHKIIVPIFEWNGHTLIRISIQAYNGPKDVEKLVSVVTAVANNAV